MIQKVQKYHQNTFYKHQKHGSAKVHKPLINGLPPFRPILSATGTPTYTLAKFLVAVLSDITQNEFMLKILSPLLMKS